MSATPDMQQTSGPGTMVRDWLVEQSLPLWSDVGFDADTGLFLERLDDAGRPLPDVPRRLMVQARQIFAFSVAARRGWSRTASDRVDRAAESMVRFYHDRDGSPGWAFSVDRSGRLLDTRRDFYTLSFVLLALAQLAALCGGRRWLALADDTLGFLDRHMVNPHGGYVDMLPLRADRQLRQNPHMHLLEALLALHEVAPEGDYLERAGAIVSLLSRRFLQGGPPVLAESFDADWNALGGPDIPFEPGHHFEWAWLLSRYSDLCRCPLPDVAASLWSSAIEAGLGPAGIIYDEVTLRRGPTVTSTRLWPYCEAAKAARCFSAASSTEHFLETLHDRFLLPAASGSWIDHFGSDGVAKVSYAPASSLYHICCAADVVLAPNASADV